MKTPLVQLIIYHFRYGYDIDWYSVMRYKPSDEEIEKYGRFWYTMR